jgi:transcriptional regulator with XRE-family HTH domain
LEAKEFGVFLKEKRLEKKLTIRQLELYSGVSNAYISQMERGLKGIPSPDILQKLSKPIGVSYEELMEKAGYITKEDILKTALPHINFDLSQLTDDAKIANENVRIFFEKLKEDPDEMLSMLSDERRSSLIDSLISSMKENNMNLYERIVSLSVSNKEKKIIDMLSDIDDLTEDKLNQVVDFVKFLKSKE